MIRKEVLQSIFRLLEYRGKKEWRRKGEMYKRTNLYSAWQPTWNYSESLRGQRLCKIERSRQQRIELPVPSPLFFLPLEELLYARELRNLLLAAKIRKGVANIYAYIYTFHSDASFPIRKMKTDGHKCYKKGNKKNKIKITSFFRKIILSLYFE